MQNFAQWKCSCDPFARASFRGRHATRNCVTPTLLVSLFGSSFGFSVKSANLFWFSSERARNARVLAACQIFGLFSFVFFIIVPVLFCFRSISIIVCVVVRFIQALQASSYIVSMDHGSVVPGICVCNCIQISLSCTSQYCLFFLIINMTCYIRIVMRNENQSYSALIVGDQAYSVTEKYIHLYCMYSAAL